MRCVSTPCRTRPRTQTRIRGKKKGMRPFFLRKSRASTARAHPPCQGINGVDSYHRHAAFVPIPFAGYPGGSGRITHPCVAERRRAHSSQHPSSAGDADRCARVREVRSVGAAPRTHLPPSLYPSPRARRRRIPLCPSEAQASAGMHVRAAPVYCARYGPSPWRKQAGEAAKGSWSGGQVRRRLTRHAICEDENDVVGGRRFGKIQAWRWRKERIREASEKQGRA
ncbi:hypothetical protein C8R47DRAFT_1127448 [Mycena vitilis]|nr:hypothetical protein C8R47DRAFT_1127448 [Mycena vitilis]